MTILVHKRTQARLNEIQKARGGSYIFHGPRSVGKATAAYDLARHINCLGDGADLCTNCRQFEAGTYPDLAVMRPEEKPSITIEQVRALVQTLSLSLYYANGVRCVLIDSAHKLTVDAQNALLKLVEEPPPSTIFIFITPQLEVLLPTIRSRCVSIYFPRLSANQIAEWLERAKGLKPHEAEGVAQASEGLPGLAYQLTSDPEAVKARRELVELAAAAPRLDRFGRLLLARRLYDEKKDIAHFGELVHSSLRTAVKNGEANSAHVAQQFGTLERFRRHMQAGVAPRVALEDLLLEL